MRQNLAARMAWRYLRARKSHSAVSAIAAVSVAGVAVATAAIVCVLSVFNGFRSVLAEGYSHLMPDIVVAPAEGKVTAAADSLLRLLRGDPDIALATPTLTDNALVIYGNREMPVTLKGVVPGEYRLLTAVDSIIYDGGRFIEESAAADGEDSGESEYYDPDADYYDPDADTGGKAAEGIAAVGVAAQLGMRAPGEKLLVFAPRRHGRVNMSNPLESFVTDSLTVAGIFQAKQAEYDENAVICDIETARGLFQYDGEASAIEMTVRPGADPGKVAARLARSLGPDYTVTDRERQQSIDFHMVAIEKWVSFLLLFFILVIASFNIISTMSMLVLEKQGSMPAMRAMGMSRREVGRVFWWESIYVTATGGAAGIAIGVALCLAQQHFGLIKLASDPDALIIDAYPVVVEWSDILLTLVPVWLTGLLTAWIASGFARSRCDSPGA